VTLNVKDHDDEPRSSLKTLVWVKGAVEEKNKLKVDEQCKT